MPMIRTVLLGDDDVIVQRKRWWLPRSWTIAWYNVSKLSAARNAVEREIDQAIGKLEDLLQKLQDMEEDLAAEVRDVRMRAHTSYGEGDPYNMPEKRLNEWVKTPVSRPNIEYWEKFFHPLVLKRYGVDYSLRKLKGRYNSPQDYSKPSRPVKGEAPFRNDPANSVDGTFTYTLENTADSAKATSDNPVIPFKEEKQQKKDSPEHKERMRSLRRDNPKYSGESDKEWNERINELASESKN